MKKIALAALTASVALASTTASAWSQETHRRIAIDAVNYMKNHPTTTNYAKLAAAAQRSGYTIEQVATILGQGAYDVDDFMDTYLCGAVTGDCQAAPVWGLASDIVKYTSYFHFQQHTRGAAVGPRHEQLVVVVSVEAFVGIRIGVILRDPEPPLLIPAHGDGLLHIWLRGEQRRLESRR